MTIGKSFDKSGPTLTERYNGITVTGFPKATKLDSIMTILSDQGLKITDQKNVLKDEKSGKISISDMKPGDCIMLLEKMHGKVFPDSKVFLKAVVSSSPVKSKSQRDSLEDTALQSKERSLDPPDKLTNLSESSLATLPVKSSETHIPPCDEVPSSQIGSTNLHSETQGKECDLLLKKNEEASKVTISPSNQQNTDLFSQKYDKRRSEFSPETAVFKKEKKRIKEVEKATRKQIA